MARFCGCVGVANESPVGCELPFEPPWALAKPALKAWQAYGDSGEPPRQRLASVQSKCVSRHRRSTVCICENPSPIPAVARSGKFRCDLLRGVCRDYSLVVRVSWRLEKQDLSAAGDGVTIRVFIRQKLNWLPPSCRIRGLDIPIRRREKTKLRSQKQTEYRGSGLHCKMHAYEVRPRKGSSWCRSNLRSAAIRSAVVWGHGGRCKCNRLHTILQPVT